MGAKGAEGEKKTERGTYNCFYQSAPLSTNPHGRTGVLDVRSAYDMPRGGEQRGADAEIGVGT